MGRLFDAIRQLLSEGKYVVGQHASERLEERGIMAWLTHKGKVYASLEAARATHVEAPNEAFRPT